MRAAAKCQWARACHPDEADGMLGEWLIGIRASNRLDKLRSQIREEQIPEKWIADLRLQIADLKRGRQK
jgi:hypothetical protein